MSPLIGDEKDFLHRLKDLTPEDVFWLAEKHRKNTKLHKKIITTYCDVNLEFFIKFFFPEYCKLPFNPLAKDTFQTEVDHHYHDQIFKKTDLFYRTPYREAIASPRGSAKSVLKTSLKPLWLLYRSRINNPLERYIIIISNTYRQATGRLRVISDEIEQNEKLAWYYGNLKGAVWRDNDLVTGNGVRIQASSPESELRGESFNLPGIGIIRPSLVILDDVENSIHVLSSLQREKMLNWFRNVVLKLPGGGNYASFSVVGTLLHPDSLLSKLVDLMQFVDWKKSIYRSVIQFSASPLWDQWHGILGEIGNENRLQDAKDFFESNKKEMLEGTKVMWPESESYYDLMLMKRNEGEHAFLTEKQNDPKLSTICVFDFEEYRYFSVKKDTEGQWQIWVEGELKPIPLDDLQLYAFLDPSVAEITAKSMDYAAISVVGRHRSGYVFWLWSWMEKVPPDEQITQIFRTAQLYAEVYHKPLYAVAVESNQFQRFLLPVIEKEKETRMQSGLFYDVDVIPHHQSQNKEKRIVGLQIPLSNGTMLVNRDIPRPHIEHCAEYTPLDRSQHDDLLDSLEGAYQLAANPPKSITNTKTINVAPRIGRRAGKRKRSLVRF